MEYNSHEDYNPIFAIFSRKQKCIYNNCGRSSDLLPYLNAFPSIIDSGQLTVDNILMLLSVSR